MIVMKPVVLIVSAHEDRIGGPGGTGFPAVGFDDRAGGIVLACQALVGIVKIGSLAADILLKLKNFTLVKAILDLKLQFSTPFFVSHIACMFL